VAHVDNVSLPVLPHCPLGFIGDFLVIREFCASEMPVLMIPADYDSSFPNGCDDGTGKIVEIKFGELLPLSFGPEHLELPRGNA
jgi:hypothetical protein